MTGKEVLKKNKNFYIGVIATVLEGLLSGSLFMLLYFTMLSLWSGEFNMNRSLMLTGVLAVIFLLRILIYSFGYTRAQIGGAEVSKNIRLFMGDKIKRIPLSRFTQGQTGDYINTITSDVNNYEKILTHKIGDLAKSISLSLMLMVFVMTFYVPAGIVLLVADLLLIPALWLSFRMVRKYGNEKNDICAENVSSIVEYVSGIQTFRAYGVGGTKNKTVTKAMKDFCDISFVYEAKVLPIGAVLGILIWLSCPLIIWMAYGPWAAGTLDTVSYALDPQAVNALQNMGQGQVVQGWLTETHPYYKEYYEGGHVPYDPEKAKELMAQAGFPDGFDCTLVTQAATQQIATVIQESLRQVGINMEIQTLEQSTYVANMRAGEYDCYVGATTAGTLSPDNFNQLDPAKIGVTVGGYRDDRPEVSDMIALASSPDEATAQEGWDQLIDLVFGQYYCVGLCNAIDCYGLAGNLEGLKLGKLNYMDVSYVHPVA